MNEAMAFIDALKEKARMFAPSTLKCIEENKEDCEWLLDPLAVWAEKAYGPSIFEQAIRGYAQYCMHVAQANALYEKKGSYTPDALEHIQNEVYENSNYMVPYMWAAILIYAFWPSMVKHIHLFRHDFLKKLKPNPNVLELASGHGVLSLISAHYRKDARVTGVDISPPAVQIAKHLGSVCQSDSRVHFEVADALDVANKANCGAYQGVIGAMLAEHLEEPQLLFDSVAHHLSPDGLAYVSTALESPQVDHIYEFNHESEPVKMAENANLKVIKLISISSTTAKGRRFAPRAMAMILQHK